MNTRRNTETKVIVVHSFKGGVGKSTTAINLSALLTEDPYNARVLLCDLDPQATTTDLMFIDSASKASSIGNLLWQHPSPHTLQDAVERHFIPRLDVAVGGGASLKTADFAMTATPGAEKALRDLLATTDEYDYIVLDTAPGMDRLVLSALIAADAIIVPCESEPASVLSVNKTIAWVREHQEQGTVKGCLLGLLWSQWNPNLINTRTSEELADQLGLPSMQTKIPQRTELARVADDGRPYVRNHPNSYLTGIYGDLLNEILQALDTSAQTREAS